MFLPKNTPFLMPSQLYNRLSVLSKHHTPPTNDAPRFGIAAFSQSAVLFGGKMSEDSTKPLQLSQFASVFSAKDNTFLKLKYSHV